MSYFDFQSVPRYIQSPDILKEFKRHVMGYGRNILIITACSVMTEQVKQQITDSFNSSIESQLSNELNAQNHKYKQGLDIALQIEKEETDIKYTFADYDPIPLTFETAKELSEKIIAEKYDFVVGIGGGKAQDFVRAARHFTEFKMALVPTVSSTNASATNYCVIYNSEGNEITNFWALRECQELVLADPKILIGAPIRTLTAGIGDQISTYYEALNWSKRTGKQEFYSAATWEYIKASIDVLQKYGPIAYKDALEKKVSNAYETVIALILHTTGIIRAGCVSGVGHLIDEGLIALAPCRKFMHGELVGYGVIPMMVFDNEPKEKIYEYVDFCRAVHIPVTLKELGIENISEKDLELVCEKALNGTMVKSFPYEITKEEMKKMILDAEKLVNGYLAEK